MKALVAILSLWLILTACSYDQSRHVADAYDVYPESDTTTYPQFIEGGSRVVYQFGHMTPDKGLRLYRDTMTVPSKGIQLDKSLRDILSDKSY